MVIAVVNGCELYYELRGAGPDLVFVHGEDHGPETFSAQVEAFSSRYRCLTYCRRGHGKSSSPLYGYSLWCQTVDLARLLDHMGSRVAVVIGVGIGNPIAVSYALRFPERVRALVLVSWYELLGYPRMEERRRTQPLTFGETHVKMFEVRRAQGRQGLRDFITREADSLFPHLPRDAALRSIMIDLGASHPEQHYLQAAELYTSIPDMLPDLERVDCQILGVCGQHDPAADQPELLAHVPNFRQAWIPQAGRFSPMEQPEEFNRVVDEFLRQLVPLDESQPEREEWSS